MSNYSSGVLESRKDFKNSPEGQYEYWHEEMGASGKARKNWHKQSDKIVKRFIDSRRDTPVAPSAASVPFRLNLFHANVVTLTSLLYGRTPKVDVSRRYADPNDDVSRVASEMMERILNNDISDNGDEYDCVLRSTLQDRLLSGLGCARVRYEAEFETVTNNVIGMDGLQIEGQTVEEEQLVFEKAPVDYFFWRDVLWGWTRSWSKLPWLAYRSYVTKDEATARWGDEAARGLTFKKQMVTDDESESDGSSSDSPWQKAEVWEIWDKEKRNIVFYSEGYSKILETKEDTLGLNGFFPSPPFFLANPTTTLYEPTPDYHLAQDLYNEIDKLQTRIAIITEAVKVVGLYNSDGSESVGRMFKEGVDNTLIPVDNWAIWGENGGMQGNIDWFPIMDVVGALDKLRELRDEQIQLLYQVTGMADVMRGGGGQYEGTGQAQLKAKYGTVRVQALQDEFATFATDIMDIKAEIIAKHFDPKTIAERSNIMMTADADMAEPAIELIKDYEKSRLSVTIRPESIAMIDYAELRQERSEYMNAVATFMQSSAPLLEQKPEMAAFLLQLFQWSLAGFKGSSEMEGVIDKAISEMQRAQKESEGQEEKPDPDQMRAQAASALEQMKQEGELAKIQAKAQADSMAREQDKMADIETIQAQTQAKLAETNAELTRFITEEKVKLEAAILLEQVQAQSNIQQTQATVEGEIQKDMVEAQLNVETETAKTRNKINEIAAGASAKIQEAAAKPTNDAE